MMKELLVIGGIYRHYKGALYQILALSTHTELERKEVVYMDAKGQVWNRPLDMFVEVMDNGVERFKLEDNQKQVYVEYLNANEPIAQKRYVTMEVTEEKHLNPLLMPIERKHLLDTLITSARTNKNVFSVPLAEPTHLSQVVEAVEKFKSSF